MLFCHDRGTHGTFPVAFTDMHRLARNRLVHHSHNWKISNFSVSTRTVFEMEWNDWGGGGDETWSWLKGFIINVFKTF